MRPKVCLVLREFATFNRAWTQILRNLGIDYTLCTTTGSSASANIQTPQGVFSASSPDLRNYFRQFDAVILCDNANSLSTTSLINYSVFWMRWNDPEDPPFLFFNPHFSTAITESAYNSNFPSDFPIVRPNPSDLSGTLYAADGGSASASNPLGFSETRARGACVLFLAENIRAHVPTICNAHSNIPYYWRLDTDKHAALANAAYTHRAARNGRAGEIIAVPAPPTSSEDTETYPSDCIVAYRYRNIFWLPHAMTRAQRAVNLWDADVQSFLFWLLYGLQLAGVRPRYRIPIQLETDHPIELFFPSENPPYSYVQQCDIQLASWDWMRDFARRKNTAIISGVRTGGRDRISGLSREHWTILYSIVYPAESRARAMQIHELLIAGHREGTIPCGPHDHTLTGGSIWSVEVHTNFGRHAGRQRGTPNDAPIARGRYCVAPHVLPAGAAGADAQTVQVGDTEMVEWDIPTSGTNATFNLPTGNLHAARMIVEGHIDEMLALGFPDYHCGEHRYTNTARNHSGGECYWQAHKEVGFRGMRSTHACNGVNTKRVVPNRLWYGFHLVTPQNIDPTGSDFSYGLYHPTAPAQQTAVGGFELDHSGDISTNWATQPVAAWRAYRRLLCQLCSTWLSAAVVGLGSAYFHPMSALMCASLTDTVAPFDGWSRLGPYNTPHYNHAVEILTNMDAIVQLLPDVLYWGTITDVMDHRERVMAG